MAIHFSPMTILSRRFWAVLQKELIRPAAHWNFFGSDNELTVFPLEIMPGIAVDRLAKPGAGQHGGIDPFADLFALSLGKHPKKAEEHPTASGACQDEADAR